MTEMSDNELLELITFCKDKKSEADSRLKKLTHELLIRKEKEIKSAYMNKGEQFGNITLYLADDEVVFTTPKKITWDQERLAALSLQIAADGGNVSEYIDIEYSVPESKWNAWGENLQSHFIDARTVTPGNISVKIKERKE